MKYAFSLLMLVSWYGRATPMCPLDYQKDGFDKDLSLLQRNADPKKTWKSLLEIYESHLKNTGCDDGFMAEGFSDLIPRLLSKHWTDAQYLFDEMSGNPKFSQFVIGHIDATSLPEDVKNLEKNAKDKCDKKYHDVCARILRKIKASEKKD